jgi:DNA polymerase
MGIDFNGTLMKAIVLDFETFYGDGYSLSRKDVTTESYIRDPRFKVHGVGIKINGGPSKWVTARLVQPVLNKLELHKHMVIGHNLQFDGSILGWKYGIYPKLYVDTLALSRAIVGPHSARHGLKYIAKLLCDMTKMDELSKSYNVRDLPPSLEARIADYCVGAPRWVEDRYDDKTGSVVPGHWEAGDTELTWAIFKKLIPYFPRSELASMDWTIRAFTDPKLLLDTEMLAQYQEQLKVQKQQALLDAGLTDRAVLMSNPKFAEALERFGVTPPTKITKTGRVTFAFAKTDEGLKELLEHPNENVQALVAARLEHKSTIEETRTTLYHAASLRGFWPVGYNYAGAMVTQRYSGNKGGGGNPQNLKRGGTLRRCIYAPEGFTLGVADLSQIEARITLWLGMQITGPDGEEAKALQVMAEGGDIYGWFGTDIYGYPINKKDTPAERQVSKSAVLGLGFGMGPDRFIEYCKQSNIYGITPEFAAHIVQLYRGKFIGVRQFWRQCTKAINGMMQGVVDTPLPMNGVSLVSTCLDPIFHQPAIRLPNGLCIKYPGLSKNGDGEVTYLDGQKVVKLFGGKVTENIVQAVSALIMREQKTEVNKVYSVQMTTHDELVSLVPESDEDEREFDAAKDKWVVSKVGAYSAFVNEVMTRPIPYLPGLPLGIESDTAIRYGDAK